MANIEEQDRSPRINASLSVVLSSGETHYVGEVENVSNTGLRIFSKNVFPIGTEIQMVFGRSPDLPPVNAVGIVRWSETGKGVGVEFTSISHEDHQSLMKFMNSLTQSEQA